MRIGIFLPNWIGDAAMATPTLRALRKRFPAPARLVGIMRPYVAEVLAGTTWLDAAIQHPPGDGRRGASWRFWRALKREQFDQVVLLTNSWRSAWWAWASRAQKRWGYARDLRGLWLTHQLQPLRAGGRLVPTPVLDYYLELAYALGCERETPRLELATSAADELAADRVWARWRLPSGGQVVAINTGGAYGSAKLWPTTYFAALAQRIATQRKRSVLVVCGPAERELAQEIVRGANHPRVVSLADESLSIGLTKACIRRSGLLVTTDSGPRHFAAAFDVPVITLFGPTHIAWSENHHPRAVHLQLALECSPCQQRTCPLGHHRCMRDLSINEVYRAVVAQLSAERAAPAA